MKTREETQEQTVTRYIADDGKEFTSRAECTEYEWQRRAREAEKRIGALPHFTATPPFTSEDDEWRWYFVNSQEDVENIAAAFFDADSVAHEFHPKAFPCWVAAILDGVAAGSGMMTDHTEYAARVKDFAEKLTAEIVAAMVQMVYGGTA